jgi:hypothetical protein
LQRLRGLNIDQSMRRHCGSVRDNQNCCNLITNDEDAGR